MVARYRHCFYEDGWRSRRQDWGHDGVFHARSVGCPRNAKQDGEKEMKKLILLACVAGLFGCQNEARQDYEIQCLSARTTALTTDVGHLISIVNLNFGTLTSGTLVSGTLVTPTSPVLPPSPTTSQSESTIGTALQAVGTVVQPLVPYLPGGIGLVLLGILSGLSAIFKKKD
jgi:hypothetical protein